MLQRARIGLAFLGLLLLAILLIVLGIEGSLGRFLCVVLAPGRLAIIEPANNGQEPAPVQHE